MKFSGALWTALSTFRHEFLASNSGKVLLNHGVVGRRLPETTVGLLRFPSQSGLLRHGCQSFSLGVYRGITGNPKSSLVPVKLASTLIDRLNGTGALSWEPTRYVSQTVTSKKRTKRKAGSKVIMDEFGVRGYDHHHDEMTFPVVAYATCKELQLEKLRMGLIEQGLYIPTEWGEDLNLEDVIHSTAKYSVGDEPREIFFFRDGAVVFWNVPDLERFTVLKFMKPYQEESYKDYEIMQESEYMLYANTEDSDTRLTPNGRILVGFNSDRISATLEKYSFSNAMALSVKLGIWESTLENFADGIEHVTQELKTGKSVKLTRNEVLQKSGELFSLRHELNLNSDLLDTPDFYWERETLEILYHKTINYLSINRRTQVMNERLNQCYELLELILSVLNDKHHVRLEWLIIWLITIEVGFEIWHVFDNWQASHVAGLS